MDLRFSPFIFLCMLFPPLAQGKTYVFGQTGMLTHNQQTVSDELNLSGNSFGAGAGVRLEYIEFEASFLSGKAEEKITHDNQKNTFMHAQTALLLASNFYLTRFLYFRFGYGLHRIEQKFKSPMGAVSAEGAKREYRVVEEDTLGGMILGAGAVLPIGKAALYLQIEKLHYNDDLGAWNSSLGLKFYFDR